MTSDELFAKTPAVRLFFKTAVPGAISMLASAFYLTVEGIFVGRYLGETAFAAINLAMPFVIINFALADLIGVGSSVPISISLGRGDKKAANNIFTCSLIMIVLAGALVGVLLFSLAPFIVKLMGADGEFADFAVEYLRVYAVCSPLSTAIFAMDNYLRISGYIKGSMLLNIFMSALIAITQFTFLGIFHFGVWSAAFATSIGMIISVFISLIPFIRGKATLKLCKPTFTKGMIKKIIACGSPNFLNNIAGRITSIILNAILVKMGGEVAVSVYGVLMFIEGFIQPLMYGACDSLQPAVGYNWGSKKYSRVRTIEKCCFIASLIISVLSAVIISVIPKELTYLFVSNASKELIDMAVPAIRLFSLTFITRWFSFATQSYMLAIEKPVPATLISVSTALIFPVILIVALWSLGLSGIWLNFAGTSLLAAILSAVILRAKSKELNMPDSI